MVYNLFFIKINPQFPNVSYHAEGLPGSFGNHPRLQSLTPESSPDGKKRLLPLLKQKDLYKLNDAQLGDFCSGTMTQMTGQREERWQREDGWLQESVATGGQHIPPVSGGELGDRA